MNFYWGCVIGFFVGYFISGFMVFGNISLPRWPWPKHSVEMEALLNIRNHYLKRAGSEFSWPRSEQEDYLKTVKKIADLQEIERARATDRGRRTAQ